MKNIICDCCGEEWEDTFFCEKCSNKMDVVEAMVPKLDWCGWGEDYEAGEEEINSGDVCFNCCVCHLR